MILFNTFAAWLLKAGTGIAELIALEISKKVLTFLHPLFPKTLSSAKHFFINNVLIFLQTNAPLEETRKKVWLVDSKVLPPSEYICIYSVSTLP